MITIRFSMNVKDIKETEILISKFIHEINEKYEDQFLTFIVDDVGASILLRKSNYRQLSMLRDMLTDIINMSPEEVLDIIVLD